MIDRREFAENTSQKFPSHFHFLQLCCPQTEEMNMFKKSLFLVIGVLFFSSTFAGDVWTITEIKKWRDTFLLHMDNGTVWKFQEDPGKTKYHTNYIPNGRGGYYPQSVPYHVPGRSSNFINYYQNGDPICPSFFEDHILVFKDVNGEHPVGCILEEYIPFSLPTVYEIDPKGYSVILSTGQQWTFSWWQSWASYHWEAGDSLITIHLNNSKEVVNVDRLIRKQPSFHAAPNE